jgi:phosphoribosylformylglycinamidine cyclo-ligase
LPAIFAQLQDGGKIAPEEMARTFNCGVGMAVIVASAQVETTIEALGAAGETAFEIGRIEPGQRGCTVSGKGDWGSSGDWSATHNA